MRHPIGGNFSVIDDDKFAQEGTVVRKFTGTYEECKQYMRKKDYRNVDLINNDTNRMASWIND